MAPLEEALRQAGDHRRQSGRPLVTLSYAQSLDGSLSLAPGQPAAISGPESLAMTHALRAAHDAILVGLGTVLADDPQLTVRLAEGRHPQPVILDSRLRTSPGAQLLRQEPAPWLFCLRGAFEAARARLEAAGATVYTVAEDDLGRVDLVAVLEELGRAGIDSLMVEGGATVITAFLQRNLVDQAAITIAPRFVGGYRVVDELLGQADFPQVLEPQFERYGEDLVLWGRVGRS